MRTLQTLPIHILKQIYSFVEDNRIIYKNKLNICKSKLFISEYINKNFITWLLTNKKNSRFYYNFFIKRYVKSKHQRNAQSLKCFEINKKAKITFPTLYEIFVNKLLSQYCHAEIKYV